MEKGDLRVFLLASLALGRPQTTDEIEFGQKIKKKDDFIKVYVQL
jgi:hypothetical protein